MKAKLTQLPDDFSRVVVVNTPEIPWQSSPSSGVMLRMLEQSGLEVGRTTSIVRYEPGAHLRSDSHKSGAEIIVLEGAFSDESGVYQTEYGD